MAIGMATSSVAQTAESLSSGAKVHITVAGAQDLSGDYIVDGAGDIQMLYVNQVHIAGLTPADAATLLASKQYLGKYYRLPQVVVNVVSRGGFTVVVQGGVSSQGPRDVRSDSRLNDVLQLATPTAEADLTRVEITHGLPGMPHTNETINYLTFLTSQDADANPPLHEGDVIYVPKKEVTHVMIRVSGAVGRPGQADVPGKTTVFDAIQSAGGLLETADRNAIIIKHASGDLPQTFDYDAAAHDPDKLSINPVLVDGDTITVKAGTTSNSFTITGAVHQGGQYPLTTQNFTLADAIGRAGGTTERPILKQISVVRKNSTGHSEAMMVDATNPAVQGNFLISPGDNIVIPQGKESKRFDPLSAIGAVTGIGSLFRVFSH